MLRLQSSDGRWHCWGCSAEYEPFHVSLHCDWCLAAANERRIKRDHDRRVLDDESYRWAALARAMRTDSRLDRDGGVRLLEAARKLSSWTKERGDGLALVFDRRFDVEPAAGRYVVDYDRENDNSEARWGYG